MSLSRPTAPLQRLAQTISYRFASTAAPTTSYYRKPATSSTAYKKAPTPSTATSTSTTSKASISSTPSSSASNAPPPPPSFEDIMPPPRAATPAPASTAATSSPGAAPKFVPRANAFDGPQPPAPLKHFPDENYVGLPNVEGQDWNTSFAGLSAQPFDEKAAAILLKPVTPDEIEIKPDGILYMPEIRYRRRLNQAFGPGGWGLAPRGGSHITDRQVTREWGLVCLGRLVAVARGESEYFDSVGISNAHEGAKSNALMRCCKDLGIADSLWDPTFIRKFKAEHTVEVWVAHSTKGNKKRMWRKKGDPKFTGVWKE